ADPDAAAEHVIRASAGRSYLVRCQGGVEEIDVATVGVYAAAFLTGHIAAQRAIGQRQGRRVVQENGGIDAAAGLGGVAAERALAHTRLSAVPPLYAPHP